MENIKERLSYTIIKSAMNKKHVYYFLLLLESLILIYMSLQPSYYVPTIPGFLIFRSGDIEHLIAYIIYGFLMERSLLNMGVKKHRYMLAIFLASAFAAGTELIQALVPNRFPDFIDWLIDSIGIVFGVFICKKRK